MGRTIVIKNKPNAFQLVVENVKKAQKIAAVNTVNRVAFIARKNAIASIEHNFTLRNTFTTRSVLVTPARKSAGIDGIKALAGATERAAYMSRQETGGPKRAPSGKNLIIPNTRARGGSNANVVRRKFRYDNVSKNTVRWSSRSGSRKARFVATAFVAARQKKFIRMNDAFFQVARFRKGKGGIRFSLNEILNLKHQATQTPAKPWLLPASERAASLMQEIYNEEMDKLHGG